MGRYLLGHRVGGLQEDPTLRVEDLKWVTADSLGEAEEKYLASVGDPDGYFPVAVVPMAAVEWYVYFTGREIGEL